MQRVLSVEASRNSSSTSEFVTKRLCCSFLLTVAFFAVIGGFLLGRFVGDRSAQTLKTQALELDKKLNNTFHSISQNYTNCGALASKIVNCAHFQRSDGQDPESLLETLAALNSCFNYG